MNHYATHIHTHIYVYIYTQKILTVERCYLRYVITNDYNQRVTLISERRNK